MIDRVAGAPEGTYKHDPVSTYRQMLINSGCCMVDQWIPKNPLTMETAGYGAETPRGATTGAHTISRDGIVIDSPEAVVEHMERFVFPKLEKAIAGFDLNAHVKMALDFEGKQTADLGDRMLKAPWAWPFVSFPGLGYGAYGYENYFMAYALYPEVMEKCFRLNGDLSLLQNGGGARAIIEGGLPPYVRLDHDMADGRGTLVDIKSLDRLWLPHFARCIQPFLDANIALIWHCDGNLMEMVPRLLACGLRGFQGFQYEDGMDYESICRMKSRDGEPLIIIAGVSVTRTLPHGTPDDVRQEIKWLVDKGPKTGLFLGASSSIAPGVPWENLKVMIEGFHYYRQHGRN